MLLLLCLLFSAFGPTSAQDISSVVTVSEGEDAVLNCSSDGSINMFDWKKGKTQVFMYDNGKYYGNGKDKLGQGEQFRDRVQFFKEELTSGNASIKINKTRLDDSGNYTCVLFMPDRTTLKTLVTLRVGAARKPDIRIQDEGTWCLLECSALGFPEPELVWKNSAREVQEPTKKSVEEENGQFHVTVQVTVNKSDNYTCVATQRSIGHQICSKSQKVTIQGAARKPDISVNHQLSWCLLKCSAMGDPTPELEWKNAAGEVQEPMKKSVEQQNGQFHVTVQVTVTKSDDYICVATQRSIGYQIQSEIQRVTIQGANILAEMAPPIAVIVVATIALILLIFVIVMLKRYCVCKPQSEAKGNEETQSLKQGDGTDETVVTNMSPQGGVQELSRKDTRANSISSS